MSEADDYITRLLTPGSPEILAWVKQSREGQGLKAVNDDPAEVLWLRRFVGKPKPKKAQNRRNR